AHRERQQKTVESQKKISVTKTTRDENLKSFNLRRCISAEAPDWEKRESFRAKDVPIGVYVPPYKAEIEAAKRARRKAERAAELIRISKAPSGLEVLFLHWHACVNACFMVVVLQERINLQLNQMFRVLVTKHSVCTITME
ncbi:unnamed protein product, partial [Gongylonema pulchrum]|uniref:PRP3 domain-containing protein n=1 Tax=Gongylonema pulchrum TaxID=637853 RepID=A0A183DMV0_9BILA